MDKPSLLIVDDDELVQNQTKWAFHAQYDVHLAKDRSAALEILRAHKPPLVTLDLGLPPSPGDSREGYLALGEMLQTDPLLKVVVITGQDEQENALAAIGQGAFDFFCKPVDIDALKSVLGRAFYIYQVEARQREFLRGGEDQCLEGMLGKSPQMRQIFATIRKVASADAPVLITGESGTGKEMAARAIHRLSPRQAGPLVPINCCAIPENLMESELFGHERGAFTGAHVRREGRFEAAHGGSLFLDEIGELAPALQVKLLRFLQEGEISRVGGRKAITIDARLICATNVDLKASLAEGRFREDLYYRIGVVVIAMPPLRDREGDVCFLAETLLERLASQNGRVLTFSGDALEAVEAHGWPGNVRELENRLRRAVIMAEGNRITPADLELDGQAAPYESLGLPIAREAVEREMVARAIARNRGNLTRCARELKISRPTLYELIEKLGIQRK